MALSTHFSLSRQTLLGFCLSEKLAFLKRVKGHQLEEAVLLQCPPLTLSRPLLVAVLGLVQAKCGATTYVCGISPDLSSLITNKQIQLRVPRPPPTLTPQDLRFSCAFTRVRASPYATYIASIRLLFSERLARQDPSIHCYSPTAPLVSQPRCLFLPLTPLTSLDGLPLLPYSIITRNLWRYRVIGSLSSASTACLLMTGVALVGRRWADRQCRDHIVTLSVLSPCLIIYEAL
jgi:hypothetical protein